MSNILSIGARREFDDDRKRRDLLQRLQSLWSYSNGAVASAILDLIEIQNDITGYHEILDGYGLDGPEAVNKDGFKATIEKRRAAGAKLMQALEEDRESDLNQWLEE
jgi:hypothetical protein